jgi:hypothetical protein
MRTLRPMLILLLAAVGCGSSKNNGDGGGGGTTGGSGSFVPLAIGNHWTYQVKDPDGTISSKIQTVVAEEPAGGVGPNAAAMAFRLVSGSKIADPEGDRSWQAWVDADGGKRLVRYREQTVDNKDGFVKNETYWDPPRLRLDDTPTRIAAGGNWREPDYTEHKIDMDRVDPDGGVGDDGGTSVVPDGGVKTTPAIQDVWMVVSPKQSITVPAGTFDALVVRRVGSQGSSIKNFWFARGIGKIRETEEGQPTEELSSYLVQ